MKKITLILSMLSIACIYAQSAHEPSKEFPFGQPNPEAPKEVKDFHPMIGMSDCTSELRNPDGSWQHIKKMQWEFKYIMDGKGVQDQTWIEDGRQAGSIRQYIADSSRWYVHFYSSNFPSTTLPAWEGNKIGDEIILYRDQKAPNGMDG